MKNFQIGGSFLDDEDDGDVMDQPDFHTSQGAPGALEKRSLRPH